MKVIIAGSRDFVSPHWMKAIEMAVEQLEASLDKSITEVVCGGAHGIDAQGKQWAEAKGLPVKMFPADWKKHGNAAGPIRNRQMAEYADALIVIWDGESPGSKHMLATAERQGIATLNLSLDASNR